jgi:hypothetical protein
MFLSDRMYRFPRLKSETWGTPTFLVQIYGFMGGLWRFGRGAEWGSKWSSWFLQVSEAVILNGAAFFSGVKDLLFRVL